MLAEKARISPPGFAPVIDFVSQVGVLGFARMRFALLACVSRKETSMKNQTFLMVLLSVGLAWPVYAQQSSSTSGSQASTSSDRSTSSQSSQDFWDGDDPSVMALIFHPFASKEYVRRHVQAVKGSVEELDELTQANQKAIKDVDARAQQGIQLASAKADMADQHAVDAGNRADMAQQSATTLNTRVASVETVVGGLDQYKSGQQTEIRFRPGQTVLSKAAKDALDQMASQLKGQHGYIIEVQGFSVGQGQAAIANSQKMADSVERYLVLNQEVPAYRIYVIGMGNAPAPKGTRGSRVEVNLLRNDLEQASNK
jgi:outer membrane protein OmpA-like peptidoglycan-associated protein